MSVVEKVKRRLERWSGEKAVAARRRDVVRRRGLEEWEEEDDDWLGLGGEEEDVDMDDVEILEGIGGSTRLPGANTSRVGLGLDDIDKSLLAERSDEDMEDGDEDKESEEDFY